MRRLLGVVLILVAIFGGLYVGGWLFFVKAIIDIIEAVKAGWMAFDIAVGLCKIVIGIPVVEVIAWLIGSIGLGMAVLD